MVEDRIYSCYTKRDPYTGREMRVARHSSGCTVTLLPRPGFVHSFAAVGIPYGSVHTRVVDSDGVEKYFPPGSAHFFEHMVFGEAGSEGSLFEQLSELGARANALTGYCDTVYYFVTIENVERCLELLLDAVTTVDLLPASVERERAVILSELGLDRDSSEQICFTNLMCAMWKNHPVGEHIIGSETSLAEITPATLADFADTFYTLPNFSIVLVGDHEAESIFPKIMANLDAIRSRDPRHRRNASFVSLPFPEPSEVAEKQVSETRDILIGQFLVGIKLPAPTLSDPFNARDLLSLRLSGRLFFDSILGDTAPLFTKLESAGLVNDSFGYTWICENSFATLIVGGESADPVAAAEAVKAELLAIGRDLATRLDSDDYERQRRIETGDFIRSLDSISATGMAATELALSGSDLFDYVLLYRNIDPAAAIRAMDFFGNEAYYCSSLVLAETRTQ
ncbi:MAG: insulinase family protein [Clostridiaceae bacterium]|nr:insulinase family protein [Clostridiaceae bacterium]